jgi:hypothetical protein
MSDKPLIQQALATDLSELLLQINPASAGSSKDGDQLLAALGFLKGFWQAIVREWPGVDRLRSAFKNRVVRFQTDEQDGQVLYADEAICERDV